MTPRRAKILISFSNRELKKLPLPSKEKRKEYYADTREPGLRLEVSYTGNKEFFTRIQVNRRSKRFSPGCFPVVSANQARQWLQNLKADLNRRVAGAMLSRSDQLSLSEAFTCYLDEWLKVRARRWKDDKALFIRYCTPLSDAKLCDITRKDVISLHNEVKISVSNRTANKVKTLIHRVFSYVTTADYFHGANPAAGIKNFPEKKGGRRLNEDEIGRFLTAALSPAADPEIRAVALLALFTGMRKSNILAMHESWIIFHPVPAVRIPEEEFKSGRVCFRYCARAPCQGRRWSPIPG